MKQRDIVLVPFPFSDQSGQKVRPAIVLSNDRFNHSSEDIIICALTTNIRPSKYSVIIDQDDIEEGQLFEKSAIKVESLLKIKKSLVVKTIASLKKSTFSKVSVILSEIFAH